MSPTTTPAVDPLRRQLETDRDRAVTAARGIAARGVTTFEESASLEQHLDLAERSTARLQNLQVTEPLVYAPGSPASYFRDLHASTINRSDSAALSRLERHREQMAVELPRLERKRADDLATRGAPFQIGLERRALGNTGAAGGSGGELSPPLWLIDRWASVPRAAAPLAAACTSLPLPAGASSVSVPLFTANTGEALQTTQNTALPDISGSTTASVTSGITTFGARAVVAQQLLEQTPAGSSHLDEIIFTDLVASGYEQLEAQLINGSGTGQQLRGLLNVTGTTAGTYTAATPTGSAFHTALAQTASLTSTARKRVVSMILMHPRRYFWLAAQTDSNNRPLIEPGDGEFMNLGDAGPVGPFFGGIPGYLTTAVPTTLGAGTNQDPVIVTRPEDHLLLISTPDSMVAHETYGDSVSVLFRMTFFAAFLGSRYPTATGVLNGTGLVAPSGF